MRSNGISIEARFVPMAPPDYFLVGLITTLNESAFVAYGKAFVPRAAIVVASEPPSARRSALFFLLIYLTTKGL